MRRIALLLLCSCTLARAQPADPLLEARDDLELARAVDRVGDALVLARLSAADPPLAVVRAAVHLDGPELALSRLGELARGRDPDVAPAAAAMSLAIVEHLDADQLEQREVDQASLRQARAVFLQLAADTSARADLRAVGSYVAERLALLLS